MMINSSGLLMLPNSHTYISLVLSLTYALRRQFFTLFPLLKPLTISSHPYAQLLIGFVFHLANRSSRKRTVQIPTVIIVPHGSCIFILFLSTCYQRWPIHQQHIPPPCIQRNPSHLLSDLISATLSYSKSSLSTGAFPSAHTCYYFSYLKKPTKPFNDCISHGSLCPICLFPSRANFSKESSVLALSSSSPPLLLTWSQIRLICPSLHRNCPCQSFCTLLSDLHIAKSNGQFSVLTLLINSIWCNWPHPPPWNTSFAGLPDISLSWFFLLSHYSHHPGIFFWFLLFPDP